MIHIATFPKKKNQIQYIRIYLPYQINNHQYNHCIISDTFFFSIWVFFHEHSQITGLPGKREGMSFNYLLPLPLRLRDLTPIQSVVLWFPSRADPVPLLQLLVISHHKLYDIQTYVYSVQCICIQYVCMYVCIQYVSVFSR